MPPCDSCGTPLAPDAAHCSRCGTTPALGSVLGVGTDLPPVPLRDPQGADLDRTAELPRVEPAVAPAPPRPAGSAPAHSRGSIAAMVATFIVLTVLGTFTLVRLTGPTAPTVAVGSSAGPTGTSLREGEPGARSAEPGPSAPSATSGSPSTQATPPEPAEPSSGAAVPLPSDAKRCSRSGDDEVATAYAGTDRTSCAFAGAVRAAYRDAGTPNDATSLRAFSPVTKQWYSLTCDGGDPVRCTSTTGAVVVLTPA